MVLTCWTKPAGALFQFPKGFADSAFKRYSIFGQLENNLYLMFSKQVIRLLHSRKPLHAHCRHAFCRARCCGLAENSGRSQRLLLKTAQPCVGLWTVGLWLYLLWTVLLWLYLLWTVGLWLYLLPSAAVRTMLILMMIITCKIQLITAIPKVI